MNRAQRRAAGKGQQQNRSHATADGFIAIHTALKHASQAPADADRVANVCLVHHTALEAINTGKGGAAEIQTLLEMIHLLIAFIRNARNSAANDETLEIIRQAEPAVQLAANAYVNIHDRHARTGKVGWNGSERQAMYDCGSWVDAFLEVSNSGSIERALDDGAQITAGIYRVINRARS